MNTPDLSVLVALDALLQEGSVTGAGRRLGLSTPAMSHALRRVREQLADPVLVRAGRGLVPTPRAEAIRERVHTLVAEARQLLEPARPIALATLEQTFVVHATDYVLSLLGPRLDAELAGEAPGVSLRFLAHSADDAAQLRSGQSDLAVGIYGDLPQEMRQRTLLTDRFVCVSRAASARVGKKLTLDRYLSLPHIQIAPRGAPGGYVDDVLAERGHTRRVARAVPYFLPALHLAAETDYLLTVSERVARAFGPSLGLRIDEVPFELRPYALSLLWHPRYDGDPAHAFLRDAFARAASARAQGRHAGARVRLDDRARSRRPKGARS